jgi:hypothetical protein
MRLIFVLFALIGTINFAAAQERQWTLNAALQDVSLEFGVGGTDDVGLSFYCEIGSGKVAIFMPFDRNLIAKDGAVPAHLKIDETDFDIHMQASKSASSRSGGLEGPVRVDGTVMGALNGSRELTIEALGKVSHFPMVDADVDTFLKTCTGEEFSGQ